MKFKTKFAGVAIATLIILTTFTPLQASQKGEKVFGVRTGYVSRNNSMDLGLYFQYTFSEYFRLQPAADLVFRHNNRDAFTIDINGQVPFSFDSENFSLYPFAGLNFSSWNHHFTQSDLSEAAPQSDPFNIEDSSRTNRFGFNLGAGFDLKLSSTLKLTLEAGYTFVKSNSGVRVLAGIGYVF